MDADGGSGEDHDGAGSHGKVFLFICFNPSLFLAPH